MKWKNNYIFSIAALVLFLVLIVVLLPRETTVTNESAEQSSIITFSPEVARVVEKHHDNVTALLNEPFVIEAARRANKERESYTQREVAELDQQWRQAEDNDPLIQSTLTSPASLRLLEFQSEFPEFSEIFFTDKYGLNIAATNRTSDYYQADEAWWQDTYREGTGHIHHNHYGQIEFDESAQAIIVPIYIVIVDLAANAVVGVAKTAVSIEAIIEEL